MTTTRKRKEKRKREARRLQQRKRKRIQQRRKRTLPRMDFMESKRIRILQQQQRTRKGKRKRRKDECYYSMSHLQKVRACNSKLLVQGFYLVYSSCWFRLISAEGNTPKESEGQPHCGPNAQPSQFGFAKPAGKFQKYEMACAPKLAPGRVFPMMLANSFHFRQTCWAERPPTLESAVGGEIILTLL